MSRAHVIWPLALTCLLGCASASPADPDAGERDLADAPPLIRVDAAPSTSVFDVPGESNFDVPPECAIARVSVWGAGGGHGGELRGAAGGFSFASFAAAGDSWLIVVGGPGTSAIAGTAGAGGVPGGGGPGGNGGSEGGGGGGGFSGVFAGAVSPESALILAGGGGGSGGGSGSKTRSGAGGGTEGQAGIGLPGTQTGGFAPLSGGNGESGGDGGGGGGGGWFGGVGAKNANSDAGGGGGGSGYIASEAIQRGSETGNLSVPGNAANPARGTAGEPLMPGKVMIECGPAN